MTGYVKNGFELCYIFGLQYPYIGSYNKGLNDNMTQPMIWIVGAGCGIGLGIAKSFGQRGYLPVLITRESDTLEQMKDILYDMNIEATGAVALTSDEAALRQTLSALEAEYGTPEAVVYNASAHAPGLPSEVQPSDMIEDFKVNVVGALTTAQCILPGMKTRGTGSYLLTGGGQALQPTASLVSLGVGKSGLRSLALSLHDEFKQYGLYAGTLTVCGFVQPNTSFDPQLVGEAFYSMHAKRSESEVMLKP